VIEAIEFPIRGMTCASCVSRITRALRKLDGVERVRVDLGRETAMVRRDRGVVSDDDLEDAVAAAGYEADLGAAVRVPTVDGPGLLGRFLSRVRE